MMGLTHFPKGVSSFGMPQLGSGYHFTTGKVYFVDSGAANASDGNLGDAPDKPLATLNGAMTRATANNGDFIFLMPGHAENCSSATTQVIDKAGVSVIGIGNGNLRPTFTYTATAGSFEIDAANVLVENVRFLSSISAVVVGVNVDAAGVTLRECAFDFDASGDDFLIFVDVTSQDYCTIEGCSFTAEDAAGSNEAINIFASDNLKIRGNVFYGDYANACIFSGSDTSGGSPVSTNILIDENRLYNSDTAQAHNMIDLNNATTGIISNNRLATLRATGPQATLDPGSCLCLENYVVNAVDEHGVITPTTASATT